MISVSLNLAMAILMITLSIHKYNKVCSMPIGQSWHHALFVFVGLSVGSFLILLSFEYVVDQVIAEYALAGVFK